jgi:hypothetical protein
VLCGQDIPPNQTRCPGCGLAKKGPVAAELTDLKATVRQLERFQNEGSLPAEVIGQIQEKISARRSQLSGRKPARKPVTTPVSAPAAPVFPEDEIPAPPLAAEPVLPAWRQLEDLLMAEGSPGPVSLEDRERIVRLYGHAHGHLAAMKPEALVVLARFLHHIGRGPEAFDAYRQLLNSTAEKSDHGTLALEAARMAREHGNPHQARWFARQALARSPGPEVRAEAEALLQSLFESPQRRFPPQKPPANQPLPLPRSNGKPSRPARLLNPARRAGR